MTTKYVTAKRTLAYTYVTMLTHRDKFPVSAEQQGVLSSLRNVLSELLGMPCQNLQDDAEQIAFDNRVAAGKNEEDIRGPMPAYQKAILRDQANEARKRLDMDILPVHTGQVQSWSKTGIHNPV